MILHIKAFFIGKGKRMMNKIYKVIFNRVKGRYEVVSELAKNGGKASGNSLLRTFINSGGGIN
ncbi:hypothetical protein A0U42_10085 [Megasphaera sp. DISK 18]|nr:hypothetical protein A0U42_10085 [Megasphaera sp. DISK 18]